MEKEEKENRKKETTSEEYRQEAYEHMNTLKNEWRLFGKTGVFVIAAGIAIIMICIAWFANNRQVTGSGMAIQTAGSDFELAAAGTADNIGKWDDQLGVAQGGDEDPYMSTNGSHTSISWAITADSNLNNIKESGTGISPGSSGKITFYIIARKKGDLNISLDISLKGWAEDGTTGKKSTEVASDLQQLLEGHILLFAGYDEANKTYSGWISEDADAWALGPEGGPILSLVKSSEGKHALTWQENVTREGTAYPITIYWIWPEVLGEYIFKDQTHIGNCPVLFPNDNTNDSPNTLSGLPSGLFTVMCNTGNDGTSASSNRYFKWASPSDTEDNKTTLRGEFSGLVNNTALDGMRGTNFNTITYGKMCSYYNMADQYLGENINYMELKVSAQ